MAEPLVTVAASGIDLGATNAPPRRVKLLPVGQVDMRDGRGPYMVRDQAHAARIVAATRAWLGSADMMFDYDHQSIYAAGPGKGGMAIAAGWAKGDKLSAEPDGIYANDVEWTAAARQKLAAREYRYLSPLFMAAKGSGDVMQLKNAALVNMGAIDLPAIAAGVRLKMGIRDGKDEQRYYTLDELKAAARGTPDDIRFALTQLEQHFCRQSNISFAAFLNEKIRRMEEEGDAGGEPIAASRQATGAEYLSADEIAACQMTGTSHADFLATKRDMQPLVPVCLPPMARGSVAASVGLSPDEIAACEMTGTSHADFLAAKKTRLG